MNDHNYLFYLKSLGACIVFRFNYIIVHLWTKEQGFSSLTLLTFGGLSGPSQDVISISGLSTRDAHRSPHFVTTKNGFRHG
jgi:hypothetical protein